MREDSVDELADHVFGALRVVVEGGDDGEDGGAGVGGELHVAEVDAVEWRLADAEDEGAVFFEADVGGALNEVRGEDFRILDKSGEKERALSMGANVIHIKRLHETSMMKIDASSVSFWAVANKSEADTSGLGLLERQRVKVWLRNSFTEVAKPGV